MTGSCLCDAVKISVSSNHRQVEACHCGMCRRWGGSSLLAIDCRDKVEFSGAKNITRFSSSEWAERGFCSKCGTHTKSDFQNMFLKLPKSANSGGL